MRVNCIRGHHLSKYALKIGQVFLDIYTVYYCTGPANLFFYIWCPLSDEVSCSCSCSIVVCLIHFFLYWHPCPEALPHLCVHKKRKKFSICKQFARIKVVITSLEQTRRRSLPWTDGEATYIKRSILWTREGTPCRCQKSTANWSIVHCCVRAELPFPVPVSSRFLHQKLTSTIITL